MNRTGSQTDWLYGQTPEAPPSANGELVFDAPWQARVFGMTQALVASACFDWNDFRAHLIRVIGDWDLRHAGESIDYHYYDHWLAALESILHERGLADPATLASLREALAARPADHDHHHGDHHH